MSPSQDSASHIQLPEKITVEFLADCWLIIEDTLNVHASRQTRLALAAWPEILTQFIPKYPCWLNLIEPWLKQLRSLALKDRHLNMLDDLTESLNAALDYWSAYRYPYRSEKRPQEQIALLGGFGVIHNAPST